MQGSPIPGGSADENRAIYKRWMDEIEAAKKVFREYTDRCKKILKVYKDDRKRTEAWEEAKQGHKLNILWSNIQTLQPALYSQTPRPNVSRRFLDRDETSRTAALILERNLQTAQELCDFDYVMKRVRDDYLLCGRGVDWVRFAPEIGRAPMREPVTRIQLDGTGRDVFRPVTGGDEIPADRVKQDEEGFYYETDPEEQILAYGLALDHVVWSDFLHEPVNDWSKVNWAAKRVLMRRPQLIKAFGEQVGRKIKLNKTFNGKEADEYSSNEKKKADCAEVWEIWDKARREVVWISDGYEEAPVKRMKDPLRLMGFFPFPRPLFATTTTDSLIPVPDYALYQDQAQQIDSITDRIRLLIKALRVVGLYNGEATDLSRLLSEADENEMVSVDNWMSFAQSGGMKGNIEWFPIEQIQVVLTGLFNARAQLKQDLYEVTGISDIIRGATAPSETATAQQIKANFGNLRLQDRQSEMARFARDTLRIMAEIQSEHYAPEALLEMSGIADTDEFRIQALDPQSMADPQVVMAYEQQVQARNQRLMEAVKLVQSDRLRTFKVDIETDATVAPDQQREKEARVEFLTAVSPFLEKSAQVGQVAPQLIPLLMKMLEFGVRGFRAGRTLESAIEQTITEAEAQQKQLSSQPPQPDPAAQAMAAKAQAETQKMEADMQAAQAQASQKLVEMQARSREAEQKFDLDMQRLQEEIVFRREESKRKQDDLNASIRLKELQINAELQKIQASAMEASPKEKSPLEQQKETVEIAQMRIKLAQMQAEYAALVSRLQGFENIQEILDSVGADPTDAAPIAPRRPKKRVYRIARNELGQMDTIEAQDAPVDGV